MKTVDDILDRLVLTRVVAAGIEGWQWAERSDEQWEEGILDLQTKRSAQQRAEMEALDAKADWDEGLGALHTLTTVIVRFGRLHFEGHRAKAFDFVKPDAKSRVSIVAAAERLAVLWRRLEEDWEPREGVTLASFELLLEESITNRRGSLGADVDLLLAGGELNDAAAALDADCVAWYSLATALFPEKTATGHKIRRIPTAPTQTSPGQAVISKVTTAEGGTISVEFDAPHGTRFTPLHRTPGGKEFKAMPETREKSIMLTGQPPGQHAFKLFASNSRGNGPESTEMTVTLAAEQAA